MSGYDHRPGPSRKPRMEPQTSNIQDNRATRQRRTLEDSEQHVRSQPRGVPQKDDAAVKGSNKGQHSLGVAPNEDTAVKGLSRGHQSRGVPQKEDTAVKGLSKGQLPHGVAPNEDTAVKGLSKGQQRILDSLMSNDKCFLCLNAFDDPRLLDCYHSFCKHCLDSYIQVMPTDEFIECPLCDEKTSKPQKGAGDLRKNIYIGLPEHTLSDECDVCDPRARRMATNRCLVCNQDFCEKCLKYHRSISSTREHQIVMFSGKATNGSVTRQLFCKEHADDKLEYYCVDCKELVCQHCNMTKHKQHTSKFVQDISDFFRQKLKKSVESNEYLNFVFWMTDRRHELSKDLRKSSEAERCIEADVNSHVEKWHQMIDVIKANLLKEASSRTRKRAASIRDKVKRVDRNILAFSGVYQAMRQISEKAGDDEVVANTERLIKSMGRVQAFSNMPGALVAPYLVFQPGKTSVETYEKEFGTIGLFKDKSSILAEFECQNKGSTVSSLWPIQDGRVWVIEGMDGTIKLYDDSGRVHRRLKIGIPTDDMVIIPDGRMFITCNSGKEIKVVDPKGETYPLAFTSECARGLTYNKEEHCLYVCLTEKNAFFDHDISHNNRIVKIKLDEEPDENDQEFPIKLAFVGYPVVEYPARVAVTSRGFIAISDWKRNCVTIMNTSGHVETEYFGLHQGREDGFCPRGLCSDTNGRVLVTDYNNHRIMQMDETGANFKVLIETAEDIPNPWSVSVGVGGVLWVGNKYGNVCVYRHHQEMD